MSADGVAMRYKTDERLLSAGRVNFRAGVRGTSGHNSPVVSLYFLGNGISCRAYLDVAHRTLKNAKTGCQRSSRR